MSAQPLAVIRPTRKEVAQVVNEFQLDTVEIDTAPEPATARATLWVCAAALITAVVWASVSHIDRIVTAHGKIVSTSPNVVVQPIESAIIHSIDVKVGDMVKAGTVLATLDPTITEADVEQLEARIASLNAAITRLEAEQNRQPYQIDPEDRFQYSRLQYAIWMERKTQFEAQMRLYEERIARATTGIKARESERDHLSSRLRVMREVEAMRMQLEESKTGSRLNSLVARDSRIEIERNLANAENQLLETRHELEAIIAERDVYRRQWDTKTIEEVVSRRNEREGVADQLIKARKRQSMIQLETPVDAVVLEVIPRSIGSIIKEAEPFFRLVPLNDPLEIDAQIEARDLGHVAVGDPVQIKLSAYSYQEYGMIEGKVLTISGDAFTDPNNRLTPEAPQGSFYKTRIAITNVGLHNVPDTFRLIPGMPLTAEIKVGERSIMGYFLRPILRGFGESMREP